MICFDVFQNYKKHLGKFYCFVVGNVVVIRKRKMAKPEALKLEAPMLLEGKFELERPGMWKVRRRNIKMPKREIPAPRNTKTGLCKVSFFQRLCKGPKEFGHFINERNVQQVKKGL